MIRLIRAIPLTIACATATFAQSPDTSLPTSNNREIQAVPVPGSVVFDGKDEDWDLSAGIWSYNNPTLVGKYSVWTHFMWDSKGIYLLQRYADRSPMKNAAKGRDFENSWKADAFQGRVVFDDQTPDEHQMHINAFYSSVENQPYMICHHGGLKKKPPFDATGPNRPDQVEKYGNTMDAYGGKVAFKEWEDHQGYTMEAFWPWTYIRTSGQPLGAGDSFTFGLEAMWGTTDGTALEHRLVDNLKDDSVNRIFFFRAREGWGKVVLNSKGNLGLVEQQQKLQTARLKQFVNFDSVGSIPVSYELSEDREVTIAIDDANGRRVRSLFGQYPRSKGKNTDHWDGLDDAGNPVPPGSYTASIVDHLPVTLSFVNSLYNSATPPWRTLEGEKSWGSNHGYPTTAASRGDVILVGFTGTEGSTGLMRVKEDGRILWTNGTELVDATSDDKFAYIFSREGHTKRAMIRRFNVETGEVVLFENPARSAETVLPVAHTEVSNDSTVAYADGKLFAMVPGKLAWRVNPMNGSIEETLSIPGLLAMENLHDKLLGLFSDGRVAELDGSGQITKVLATVPDLRAPARLAASQDGRRFAVNNKTTNQIFVYDDQGKALFAIGQPYAAVEGKRPAGKFVETDLINPNGMAFDSGGHLWVAEADSSCRRVSKWSPEGKFENQFWGAADYGAMSGFPFAFDSTRFIAHGTEFKLDPSPDIMHRPTRERPLIFHPALVQSRGWIYSYRGHEYAASEPLSNSKPQFIVAKRNKQGVFQPVVRIDYGNPKAKPPVPSGTWIDRNDNGLEDPGETEEGFAGARNYWSNGWMRPDLTYITANQLVLRPSFTDSGVPIYDFKNPELPANAIRNGTFMKNGVGTPIMDMQGNITNGVDYATNDGRTGSYPNPYGRHDAPAARRGLLIAPFRPNGVVEGVPGVGSITAVGGDRGEWFLMSFDGLYLSSILQDSKAEVVLDGTFVGQEAFGGFIWRDEQKRILVQLGHRSYQIMEVKGLDSTRKQVQKLNVTEKQIEEGIKLAAQTRNAPAKEPEVLLAAKVEHLPTKAPAPSLSPAQSLIQGAQTTRIEEAGDPSRWFRVALAHDDQNLAIAFQVNDTSPWKNGEGRFSHAFIGGDSVDLKLDVPRLGLIRILGAAIGGENTVVYWQKKAGRLDNPTTYVVPNNESNAQNFDIVKRLASAKIDVAKGTDCYSVLITIPMADIGLDPRNSKKLRGVAGVIYSDPAGTNRVSRLYWHDKSTGLVSDVPSEAKLEASHWGEIKLEP